MRCAPKALACLAEIEPQSQAAVGVHPQEHAGLGATVELQHAVIVGMLRLFLVRIGPQLAAEDARLAFEFGEAAVWPGRERVRFNAGCVHGFL